MIGFLGLKPTIGSDSERKVRVWLTWFFILSILALMIHTVFVSLRKPEMWQFIGEHLNQIYHGSQVITVVNCFVYGIVILVLRLRATASERWADFVGAAFLVLVIHYMGLFWLSASGPTPAPDWIANIFGTSLSALSNIFLVAAGLVLLDRDPFPRWNIVTQVVFAALGALLSLGDIRCQRFPDAIASAFCIYWVGYALYKNIRYTNSGFSELTRRIAGQIVLTSVLLYALSGFFWASVPFITNWNWNWNVRVMTTIENAAQEEEAKHLKQVENKGRKENVLQNSVESELVKKRVRVRLLDTSVILLFFLLKFVIFLAAFLLLLGAIIFVSSEHANEIFNPIVHGVSEYLTDEGVTKLIADRLEAASVTFYVSLPGRNKTRYTKFSWPLGESGEESNRPMREELVRIGESEVDKLALDAIHCGEEQRFPLSEKQISFLKQYSPLAYAQQLPTQIAVPIIFHGAVIGSLLVISRPEGNFSPREIQVIRDLARLSAPSAQSLRENAALDQLTVRFSRAVVLKPPDPTQKPVQKSDFDEVIGSVVKILHDVLNPLATGIWLDTGLQRLVALAGDDHRRQELKQAVESDDFSFRQTSDRKLDVLVANLEVRQSDDPRKETYKIGKLAVLVPADKDDLHQPVLGRNQMHFRAVTGRTISALLAAVTEYLDSVIREFNIAVNNPQEMTVEYWLSQLEKAAEKAGTLWIVAELHREKRVLGSDDAKKAFRQFDSKKEVNSTYLRQTKLRRSNGKLSIGVQGSLYHNGRNVCSLWESSFFKFAGIADSALHQIISNQEKILQLQHEATRSYEFATIAVTTAEIVHQIVNTTRDISLPLKSLYEAYLVGKLNCVDERMKKLLADLPQSASYLLELTAGFKKLSDPKENVRCNLSQAVEQAERLYALQLKKRGIVLETDIPDSLTIGVPPHVAVLALATLVGNSRDAAPNGGNIKIRAWEEGDMIRCDVTDNGHGVPFEVQSRLFRERNVTTKSNGNGWGLYLVSRSLKDRHGSIELTGSRPGETIFTIRFPKYNGGMRG